MRHEPLERSEDLGAYFAARKQEASLLSANEVHSLLARPRSVVEDRTQLARWNQRTILFRRGILSLGGATAVALATYLLFLAGTVPQTIRPLQDISTDRSLERTKTPSFDEPHSRLTVAGVAPISSKAHKPAARNTIEPNAATVNSTGSTEEVRPFCLSTLPPRVDTASISSLVPFQAVSIRTPLVLAVSEDRRRVTYEGAHNPSKDLLGSIYDLGYLTLANPVISAYDTVRSVSERTLAAWKVVSHP